MHKSITRFSIASITFLIGVVAAWAFLIHPAHKLKVMLPEDWHPEDFKTIDERTDAAGLPRLRAVLHPNDDLEVRVWVGFGINGENALILRRSAGHWSALHLQGIYEHYPPEQFQQISAAAKPRSGWEQAWQRLVGAGILTLPDESLVNCNPHLLDGVGYVVESNVNQTYRIYSYGNPEYAKCAEAKQIMNIGGIIADEFGLDEFKISQ